MSVVGVRGRCLLVSNDDGATTLPEACTRGSVGLPLLRMRWARQRLRLLPVTSAVAVLRELVLLLALPASEAEWTLVFRQTVGLWQPIDKWGSVGSSELDDNYSVLDSLGDLLPEDKVYKLKLLYPKDEKGKPLAGQNAWAQTSSPLKDYSKDGSPSGFAAIGALTWTDGVSTAPPSLFPSPPCCLPPNSHNCTEIAVAVQRVARLCRDRSGAFMQP